MLARTALIDEVRRLFRSHAVVALVGARQVGKTTLAREIAGPARDAERIFDLENPDDLARLAEPLPALAPLRGLVVLDEIQRRPDLFPVLRVLADRPRRPARFLVLGSASRDLLLQSSETLAGRIAYVHVGGLSLEEVGPARVDRLWTRGGFPRAFLARSDVESVRWRRGFIQTFLERDVPQLGIGIPAATLSRFWTMLAHYHGGVWNSSDLARAFGVSDHTVGRYLDALVGTFMVRRLAPWHENIGKRQVKAPKIYLSDSGILHALLGLGTARGVSVHPRVGASWEGFVIEQVARHLRAAPDECFFWATHTGAELDLLVARGGRRVGFEVKHTTAPALSRSMQIAVDDLGLDRLDVIHRGAHTFPLGGRVRAVAAARLLEDVEAL
ncbi:MAG: ATP-binding protein [Deltaproteobacteria bacterium]|nr:ATP-binding protein [Deltaproteobacteria bacterium]